MRPPSPHKIRAAVTQTEVTAVAVPVLEGAEVDASFKVHRLYLLTSKMCVCSCDFVRCPLRVLVSICPYYLRGSQLSCSGLCIASAKNGAMLSLQVPRIHLPRMVRELSVPIYCLIYRKTVFMGTTAALTNVVQTSSGTGRSDVLLLLL